MRVRCSDCGEDAANSCAPGGHDAAWEIALTLAGRSYRVPIYADRIDTAFASARMHLCVGAVPMRYADTPDEHTGVRHEQDPDQEVEDRLRKRARPVRDAGVCTPALAPRCTGASVAPTFVATRTRRVRR